MRTTLLAMALSIFFTSGVFAQVDCENPALAVRGTNTAVSLSGTMAPEPMCFGPSNADTFDWYLFEADTTATLFISSSLASNNNTDTRVSVYTGECDDLICIASDDDGGSGFSSTTSIAAVQGERYRIVWDDRWSTSGFDFIISHIPPANTDGGGGGGGGTGNTGGDIFSWTSTETANGSYAADLNGDHLDDVFSINGSSVEIYYQQADGSFNIVTVPTPEPDHSPSWSLSAADVTRNGHADLMYGGGSGVTFMMASDDGLSYTEQSGPEYVFCQRTNFVDLNNDGRLDAFSCHDVAPNVYYINTGQGEFDFFQGGIGDTDTGGNYGSIWSDFDNDGDVDLFLSKCRGGNSPANINQMHRNNGDGTFTDVAPTANLDDEVLTWSSAIADFDNDGDMDIFVGASSSANGLHKMMQNNGDMTFSDVTSSIGIDDFTNTSIEHYAYDFDNDGFVDIYTSGNTILHNNGDMTFSVQSNNPGTGSVGDINNDGFLDILSGGQAYLNDTNDNNYLVVNIIGSESNIDGIGARVVVESSLGTQIRDVYSGVGFRGMHTLNPHFGLGQDESVESVTVIWPSGIVDVIENPAINGSLIIEEGSAPTSLDEEFASRFAVYPTLAVDNIQVSTEESLAGALYSVFDINGRRVLNGPLMAGQIDVNALSTGSYVLRLQLGDRFVQKQFIKE